MTRSVEDIFSNTTPVGKQPLPQGNYHTQTPFHAEDYLSQYITTEDVAELLHVQVAAAQKLIRSGQVRASFIGRRWLTTRANVDAYLQSKAEGGPTASNHHQD